LVLAEQCQRLTLTAMLAAMSGSALMVVLVLQPIQRKVFWLRAAAVA
jgi:hypothetical protein